MRWRVLGVRLYTGIDDVAAALKKIMDMGAKEYEPLMESEAGVAVVNSFGNILGIMYNRHYLEILDSTKWKARAHYSEYSNCACY